ADIGYGARRYPGTVALRDEVGEIAPILNIGDHHARAFGGERLRIVSADAPGAAGDDRDLAHEPCHRRSSHLSPPGNRVGPKAGPVVTLDPAIALSEQCASPSGTAGPSPAMAG